MRRHEGLPSKWLKKEDFDRPIVCQIASVTSEEIDDDGKVKPVIWLMGTGDKRLETRGLVLNGTNWDAIADIRGEDPSETDTDEWEGTTIEIFNDPKVKFGDKRVGGLRIREPQTKTRTSQRPMDADEPPPHSDSDVPF